MGPAGAASPVTKKFVKKQINKLRAQVAASFLGETVVVTESDTTLDSAEDDEHTVLCPSGYQALGGGVAGNFDQIGVDATGPSVGGQPTNATPVGTAAFANGWFTRVFSFDADAEPYKVSVVCARPAA